MEIVKILGIGLISVCLIIIMKQYKPEFTIYISLIAGILILAFTFNKLSGIISLLQNYSDNHMLLAYSFSKKEKRYFCKKK